MLINITIDTDTKEVHVSLPKVYSSLRLMNLINLFFIDKIRRSIPEFKKRLEKIENGK